MKHTQYPEYHTYSRKTARNPKAQVFQNPTTHLHKSQVIFLWVHLELATQSINHKIKAHKGNEIRINWKFEPI